MSEIKEFNKEIAIKQIVESDFSEDFSKAFAEKLFEEINSDGEPYVKSGYHMLNAILKNDMDDFIISLCGWSIEGLLKKCRIICDSELEFNDEIVDGMFVSEWDGGSVIMTPCKVNLKTHAVLDIQLAHNAEALDCIDREYIKVDEKEFPVVHKSELEEDDMISYWYGG